MLINKFLINNGYIFVKDANPLYIKMLLDLGSIPLFIYKKDNKRIICKGVCLNHDSEWSRFETKDYIINNDNWFDPNNYNISNFDRCSITEVKIVLYYTFGDVYDYSLPFTVEPFYFFNY